MNWIKVACKGLLQLLFPHYCVHCGSDLITSDNVLCVECLSSLPGTSFEKIADNPVEKIFWGRVPITAASAAFYFTKQSVVQSLMHELKYRGNIKAGVQMGMIMGTLLKESGRFKIDALIPLPLHPRKERKRGYNQAKIICQGIRQVYNIPILDKLVTRNQFTESQTKKNRIDRWQNISGKFSIRHDFKQDQRKILLVDDVITTGATLESCAASLSQIPGISIHIACFCVAAN